MMDALRKGAASWVARIFLGILVVSFGLWGIGDIFRNFNRDVFATVGSTQISGDTFRQAYDRERQLLSRRTGRAVTNEQARALGLVTELSQRMVTETALDEAARTLSLGVSQGELAKAIIDDPSFTPPGAGGFSRPYFEQLLRENGFTEASYVAQRRALTLRRQIADGLAGGMEAPALYDDILNRFANEKRSAVYFILPREQFAHVEPPDDETLKTYYDVVRGAFKTPPRRTAEILSVSIKDLAAAVPVSDQDAKTIYDNQKERFGEVEKRDVLQWTLPSKEAAAEALAKLKAGESFDSLVEAAGKKLADIDLGTVSEQEIIDPAVRKAAFSLKEGEYSELVDSSFGPVLIAVKKVEPATVKPFEEVAAGIKSELALDRARKQVLDLVDKVEDDRAAGARLGEIAAKHKLLFTTLHAIDRTGVDEKNDDHTTEAGGKAVIDAIFRASPGSEPDPLRLSDGGYAWIDVREVIADHERPLAEVKDAVITRWMDEKERATLLSKADETIAEIRDGKSIDDVAKELGIETRQSALTNRNGTLADFSRGGVEEIFRVGKGAASTAIAENGSDRIVFVVHEVEAPPADSAKDAKLTKDLSESLKSDVLTAYVDQLQKEIGVSIDRAFLDRLAATGTP